LKAPPLPIRLRKPRVNDAEARLCVRKPWLVQTPCADMLLALRLIADLRCRIKELVGVLV
jgi:hypothetical protein